MVRVLADIVEIWDKCQLDGMVEPTIDSPLCLPPARIHFCELTARTNLDRSDFGSAVPKNRGLYWFIPCSI